MNKVTTKPAVTQVAPAEPDFTEDRRAKYEQQAQGLQSALFTVGQIADSALQGITAMANALLGHMQTADAYKHPEIIAIMVTEICARAEVAKDNIGYEAELLGLNFSFGGGSAERKAAQNAAREYFEGKTP